MGIGLGGYNSLQSSLTKPLDLSGYDRQMDELRAKNKNLQAQISRLERHNKTQSSLNISDISSRIEALETRPVVSENTGDISDLISENIDAGGSGRLISVPAEIANRLESLESQINRADPEVFLFGESLLQDQRGDVRTILPTFPETALRARLRELDVADKSWWRRSLSRHISVKKPGETDRVDDIQTHIANGDIDKALGVIENLPSQARSVVRFLNFETQISWRITIVALTLGLIVLFALWAFLGFLIRLPGRVKSGVGLRRRTQALEAMEEALIAGTQGDSAKARKKAEKARNLISSPALGRMISAQAAEASGDNIEAIAQYTAMLDDQKTLFYKVHWPIIIMICLISHRPKNMHLRLCRMRRILRRPFL